MDKAPRASWDVRRFAVWWLRAKPFMAMEDAVRAVGMVAGVTLYRWEQFQVQLFIAPPGVQIPRHTHPNVDTVDFGVGGSINFDSDRMAMLPLLPGFIHVQAYEPHIADPGPLGGAFISIQKWLNGVVPTSVELDWDGPAVDPQHEQELRR